MPSYVCEVCNFSTELKNNYHRHLKTKKHTTQCEKNGNKSITIGGKEYEFTPKPAKIGGIYSEFTPNSAKIGGVKSPNIPKLEKKIYVCEYCNKEFSRKDILKRHMEKRCQKIKNLDYKQLFYEMKNELQKEKLEFKKQINLLLEKVGNTTNNITQTQNIQLNSYGNEDMSHITDTLKTKMLKIPFGMIPKMIEAVHFNDEKPENKNISLSNIRDNKLKIYSDKGWIYKDKEETINDLVDGKYFLLDNHYQTIENKTDFNMDQTESYESFKNFYQEDKAFIEKIKRDCELILINNRK
jgi:uncharacterized Zn-finger protein